MKQAPPALVGLNVPGRHYTMSSRADSQPAEAMGFTLILRLMLNSFLTGPPRPAWISPVEMLSCVPSEVWTEAARGTVASQAFTHR